MDFDNLLGDEPPVKNRGGRPTREEAARKAAVAAEAEQAERNRVEGFYASSEGRTLLARATTGRGLEVEEREFHQPVSQNFLARVLRMDPMTISKRLRKVKPAGYGGSGMTKRALYDFTDVLPYLLKPKMDIGTYLKTLNVADMPTQISKAFWEAERIKNKTLIETGEAWPTHRVLEVLGDVFMLVKDRIPLITDALSDLGATDAQAKKLQEMCDQFQRDVHSALVEMPKLKQSYSRQADIDSAGEYVEDEDEVE